MLFLYRCVFLARYFFSDSPESAKSQHIAVFISAFAGFWRRPCFYFDLARWGLGCAATPENNNEWVSSVCWSWAKKDNSHFVEGLTQAQRFPTYWLVQGSNVKKNSGVQKVSGRYKILYLDTFLCICIVSRYIFQKSISSVSYQNFLEKYLVDT